mmetsp:Transcript_4366/g.6154  ORF Transcript_4366/g.6154 Transcript_4366/m.6154 type:complete len:1101 (-) Transcript_4366:1586-4888(-)
MVMDGYHQCANNNKSATLAVAPPPWSGRHLAVALLPLSGGPLQQHPLVVVREHLDELLHRALKVRQHVRGHRRPRVRLVLLDVAPELGLVLVGLDLLQAHQPQVAPVGEGAVRVVHVGDAPAHARGEVPPGGAQHHRAAPGHVLAAVVAHALHHGQRARVAHAEPLAGLAPEEGLAGRGPVQAHVAHDHVVLRHEALRQRGRLRVDGDLAAAEALAHVVVGVAVDLEVHALGDGEAQALAGVAGELEVHGALGQALGAVLLGDVVGEHGAHGAVQVGDGQRGLDGLPALQGGAGQLDEPVVQGVGDAVVLLLALDQPRVLRVQLVGGHQQRGQVQALGLVVQVVAVDLQHVRAAHHLLKGAEAHLGHVLPHLLGQQEEVVDHVLGLAVELLAQVRVLRGDAHGAGVQVALAHHDAAQRDEGPRGEAHLLGAQQRGHHHIAAVADLPVRLQPHARPQVVQHQRLLRLGHAQLPGQAGALHARPGRRARAAVVPRDHNVVRLGLGHARRDHAHAHLGHQLHRDLARGLRVLQVVDQLRQVLDGVDVVVRRRGDQAHPGRGPPAGPNVLGHLLPRQLAALPGLGALGHLDLDLVRVGQVVGRDPEAARGHLLDARAPVVQEPRRVLAALARVGPAAQRVHGHGQRLVRLLGDGPQAHGARGEPLHNLLGRLHLLQGHAALRALLHLEQPADGHARVLRVDQPRELRVGLLGVGARALLQVDHHLRRVQVLLAAVAVVELPVVGHQRLGGRAGVGRLVQPRQVGVQRLEPGALDAGDRAREALVDHLVVQAHGLEHLGALVALQRGDAHLAHHLQDALGRRLAVGGHQLLVLHRLAHLGLDEPVAVHLEQGLVGHVGADAVRAEAQQRRKVVHLAGVAGLGEERGLGALLRAQQVLVHGAHGQQRGHRQPAGARQPVAQHQRAPARGHRLHRLLAQPVQRLAQAVRAGAEVEGGVEGAGGPPAVLRVAHGRHLLQRQHRVLHQQPLGVLGADVQQVGLGPHGAHEGHDHLLADGVDGRVRHLREQLLEVVEHLAGLLGEHGQGRVVAHGPQGLLAAHAHGVEQHVQRLGAVPEQVEAAGAGGEVGPGRGGQLRPGRLLPRPQVH